MEEKFNEKNELIFSLTNGGALLQTGAPQPSLHGMVMNWCSELFVAPFNKLDEAMLSGDDSKVPLEMMYEKPFFEHLYDNPELTQSFGKFMTEFSFPEVGQVQNFFDKELGKFVEDLSSKQVVDVGGSEGFVLEAIQQNSTFSKKPKCLELKQLIDTFDLEKHKNVEKCVG